MKKIAFIFFLIFTLVQAGPAIASLFSPHQVVFMVDEEKNEDKSKSDIKDGKKYLSRPYSFSFYQRICSSGWPQPDEDIHPSPCLERVCPPPNFY